LLSMRILRPLRSTLFPYTTLFRSHLFQSLLRGLSGDAALPEWLRSCILPTAPHFRPEDLYWGIRLSLAECIESGVTTVADWAFRSEEHTSELQSRVDIVCRLLLEK